MSAAAGRATVAEWDVTAGLRRFSARVRQRLRDPRFWVIQLGVFAVMGLHGAVEGFGFFHGGPGAVLVEVSVVLYLAPVVYAGLRYGFEGGALTATWATLLALPNLLLWHRDSFEWLGEMIVLGFVITTGVVIAIPVERERRQRAKAEAANERLRLLNDVASLLLRTVERASGLDEVTQRLVAVMDLSAVAVIRTGEDGDVTVESCAGRDVDWTAAHLPATRSPSGASWRRPWRDGAAWSFPVDVDGGRWGWLVAIEGETRMRSTDREVLAAVAVQLGVAIDNERLHRQEEEQLRTYLTGVTRAQEDERTRIARDLHDIATHELLLVCREVDALLEDPGAGTEQLANLRDRTASVVDYLRRFTRDLRPSILDPLGLVPALEWLAGEVAGRCELAVDVAVRGQVRRLPAETEIALFRIVEEALRNAERHGAARRVLVDVDLGGDVVLVAVEDDGVGLPKHDDADLARRGKLGILGMRERAQLIGGSLSLGVSPMGGARVAVRVPVAGSAPVVDAQTGTAPGSRAGARVGSSDQRTIR